jgi:hypothetical protein
MKNFIFLIILSIPIIIFAQEFQITDDGGDYPLISRYSYRVYYYTNSTNEVRYLARDLKFSYLTSLPSLPSFYNNSPIALYLDSPFLGTKGDIYSYNDSTEQSSFLMNANPDSLFSSSRKLLFSPSGNKVMIYDRRPDFVDLHDSTIVNVDIPLSIISDPVKWGENDSIIYFLKTTDEGLLLRGNVYTSKQDTILNLPNYGSIRTFDYNRQRKLIVYTFMDTVLISRVNILNIDSGKVKNIWNPLETSDEYDGGLINEIYFSPNSDRIAFYEIRPHISSGALFLYDLLEDKIYYFEDLVVNNIAWFNNDTLIYSRAYSNGLNGYSLKNATHIPLQKPPLKFTDIYFHVFPNPFNSNINLMLDLDQKHKIDISIYSINGELITHLFNGLLNKGIHKFNWNVSEGFSGNLSSAVYIARVKYSNKSHQGVSVRKILYLK